MFRPIASSVRQPSPRRGALLIAVLGLLTLFAIFALFFVFYADAEATSSRIHREAQSPGDDVLDGTPAFNQVLASLIFDVDDTTPSSILNPLRGHSLARSMYGGQQGLSAPFSGIGTFHEAAPHGQDRATWINFSSPYTIPSGPQAGTYFLDPEWTQFRLASELGTAPGLLPPATVPPRSQSFIPKNAPYTYPDLKDLILASLSPATGEVLVPSLHRNWLFNANNANAQLRLAPWNPADVAASSNTAANTDWISLEGRTRILRLRPVDQLTASDFQDPPASDPLDRIPTGPTVQYPFALSYTPSGPLPYPIAPLLANYNANQMRGLYNRIQQRIAQGRIIGYPKPNADGSYSGDVQNLMGGVGVQKNDSILVDIGLPPKLWNGRWIKPLASILLTDLDGFVNLNVHGNTRNASNHGSYAGYGPHEVNLNAVLNNAAETNALVNLRNGSNTARNGTATLAYDRSNVRLPQYSLVNFDASGTPGTPAIDMPGFATGNAFQTSPSYNGPGFFDDNTNAGKYQNHPLLFNPSDWPAATGSSRTFPHSDLKRFQLRYGADRTWYDATSFGQLGLVASSLRSSTSRTDPAHATRGLVSTHSSNFDLPGLVPNFSGGGALQLNGLHPTNAAFASPYSGLGTNKADLGPVDLNRPLADYRNLSDPANTPAPTPLSPTNMGNYAQAWVDRHNLARDILGRLIVATGAQANVYTTAAGAFQAGDIEVTAMPGTPEHNAVRYLAQLAANMVDLVDSDDISTAFAWETGATWTTPRTITQVTTADIQAMLVAAQAQPGGVVFGVEKPRLVINEAYGEITNEPGEAFMGQAMRPARVRFWVELLNPGNTTYSAPGSATIDDAVALRPPGGSPYQLQVTQITAANQGDLSSPTNTSGAMTLTMNGSLTFDFSTAAGRTVLPVGAAPAPGPYAPVNGTPGFVLVGPQPYNGGTPHMVGGAPVEFSPNTGAAPWSGMILGNAGATSSMEYQLANMPPSTDLEDPTKMQPLRQHAILLRRLANPYLQANPPVGGPFNPALPYNPYVTVDVMKYVPAYDAVVRGGGAMDTLDRTGKGGGTTTTAGFEDIGSRFAVGKVQPYAGFATQGAPGGINNVTEIGAFPQSMVIRQNPNPLLAGEPQHTFFRMNGRTAAGPTGPAPTYTVAGINDTIMAPFDWYVHFDRPVVNSLELLSTQAVKPHEVTQYFIQPPGGAGQPVRRGAGQAPWFGVAPPTGFPNFDPNGNPTFATATNNGLLRALDMLRVKPWMYGSSLGGKVTGKININTIQDPRILAALIDPQSGNAFSATEQIYNPANLSDPATVWGRLIGNRTINQTSHPFADGTPVQWTVPTPGPSVDDLGITGMDRPFKPFGVPEYAAAALPTAGAPATALNAGSGLQDTLLRANPSGSPLLFTSSASHPYLQAEMVRKMMNNTTTTSNAFAVTVTIVFHEVRMNGTDMVSIDERVMPPASPTVWTTNTPPSGSRFLLGREAFREAPGDLRQQFYTIVDRSNIGFVPVLAPGTPTARQAQPFYGALTQAPVSAGADWDLTLENGSSGASIYSDGMLVPVAAGDVIVVGVGSNKELVQVVSAAGGVIRVSGLSKPHFAGELVSNMVLGNPGPLGSTSNPGPFDARSPSYSRIVPFAQRVR